MSSESFIAAIKKHGVSKTNRFRVEIPLPATVQSKLNEMAGYGSFGQNEELNSFGRATKILKNIVLGRNSNYTRGLELMCETAQLPGQSFLTTDRRTNTTNRKLPYDTQFEDAVFTFYVSSDMLEKTIIETWQNTIYDRKTHSFEYYDKYVTDIVVHQLDLAGNVTHTIRLIDAYPVQVNALDLNAGTDDIHKISVTFTFYQWTEGDGSESDTSISSGIESPSDLFEAANNPKFLNKVYDIAVGNNPGFSGEALFVYEKISNLTKEYANISAGELSNIISTVKNDLGSSNDISNEDKLSLSGIIDDIKDKLK